MEKKKIILNADMGEGFGSYRMGNDDEIMPYLSSVNLACGFHGGDPVVMRHSVQMAKQCGVSVGAHPGFHDLQGFGRRMVAVSEEELYCDLMYQLGALDSFVRHEGMELTHICPHGVMDTLVSENESFAKVFMQAVKDYKADMKIIIEEKCLLASMCEAEGLKVAAVGYPDLEYDTDGNMIITREKEVMKLEKIVEQSIRMVVENKYRSMDGKEFPIHPDVLCLHSDVPNSLEIMQALRKGLTEAGIEIVTF